MPWVAMIVLGCCSDAVAQTSYKVVDLGVVNDKDNFSCAMDLNNFGWTLSQEGVMDPVSLNAGAIVLPGQSVINIGEFKIDLGTLGGPNSWMNWGGINDFAQAVGEAETAVLDPDGEDICGFGTHLTCRPFFWQFGHMSALPTLGGNNGSASDINNRGKSQALRKRLSVTPHAHHPSLSRLYCRYYGKRAESELFRRWMAIQTGSHSRSTIKATP